MNLFKFLNLNPTNYIEKNNKRGTTYNYNILNIDKAKIYAIIEELKNTKMYENAVTEFNFLIKKRTLKELEEFKNIHPWWVKEDIKMLKEYNKFYSDFNKAFYKNSKDSKNIISTNNKTCLTMLQFNTTKEYKNLGLNNIVNIFEGCFNVVQRSCDLSLGFLADLITIYLWTEHIFMLYQNLIKIKINWQILMPHIYKNNYNIHLEDWENWKPLNRPKYIFNVRENKK